MDSPQSIQNKPKGIDLASLISMLLLWKKFLITMGVLISIVSVIIALIIPLTYSSSATLLPPGQSSPLGAFLPQEMTRGLTGMLGSAAFDKGGESNKVMAILKSRNLAEKTIREFNLMELFEAETIEDALESFREKLSIVIDEEMTIRVTTNYKTDFFHPEENEERTKILTTQICQFIIDELDNIYTALGTQKARYELDVIEKRYEQNRLDLRRVEEEFRDFSKEHGVIALPEQTEAMIRTLAELESQLIIEDVKLEIAKANFSESSSEVRTKQLMVNELYNKLATIKTKGLSTDSLQSTLPAFTKTPDLALTYVRLERELTVQNIIYEFLTQQVEHLKMQEAKDTPSIQYVDLPQMPTKRTAPRRSLLVIGLVFAGMLLTVSYVILYTYYAERIKNFIYTIKRSTREST